jgi:DNA-binding Lrp family transcriptional regulator
MAYLDEIDWKILAALQKRSNLRNNDLADDVGLTPAPCLRRVKNLSQIGIIKGFSITLDNKQLGFGLSALVEVTLTDHSTRAARKFLNTIQGKREIIACYMVTGDCDFILRIMTAKVDMGRLACHRRSAENSIQRDPGNIQGSAEPNSGPPSKFCSDRGQARKIAISTL